MQAQHLTKPTRLLDCSLDWIRALYFLLEDETQYDEDGAFLYTSTRLNTLPDEELDQVNPYTLDRIRMICPITYWSDEFLVRLRAKRKYRQIGRFLALPLSMYRTHLEETYDTYFNKIIIPKQDKPGLRAELMSKCITYHTMYFTHVQL
jgi:hypothetical protein